MTFCSNDCLPKTSIFCIRVRGVISVRKKSMSKPRILCAFLRKISLVEFLPSEPFNHAAHFDRSAKIILRQSNRKKKIHSVSNLRDERGALAKQSAKYLPNKFYAIGDNEGSLTRARDFSRDAGREIQIHRSPVSLCHQPIY